MAVFFVNSMKRPFSRENPVTERSWVEINSVTLDFHEVFFAVYKERCQAYLIFYQFKCQKFKNTQECDHIPIGFWSQTFTMAPKTTHFSHKTVEVQYFEVK